MDTLEIESKLRRATKSQLVALNVIAKSKDSLATTSELQDILFSQVDNSTSTANQSVGGVISAISRMRVGEHSLLIPMGKDDKYGIRWKLNEKVISKEKLKEIVQDVLQSM